MDKFSCGGDSTLNKPKNRELLLATMSVEEADDFEAAVKILSPSQRDVLYRLYEAGQTHIFKNFINWNPRFRREFADHLEKLDDAYPNGGIIGYLDNAKKLLENSRQGVNPLEGWEPSVPQGEMFELGTAEYSDTEAIGMQELGKIGFVLVAGGLGERLGYSGIKVCFISQDDCLNIMFYHHCLSR